MVLRVIIMRHISFSMQISNTYKYAILIKEEALNKQDLLKHYVSEIETYSTSSTEDIIGFSLKYDTPKKVLASTAKGYLQNQLLPTLKTFNTEYLLVCDSNYFKFLTGVAKTEPHHGYVLPCKLKGFEDEFQVVLCPNYQAIFYNPDIKHRIELDIRSMCDHAQGNYKTLGEGIIHQEEYHTSISGLQAFLNKLNQYPVLTCDTETFSLKHYDAGLGTIGFAWNQHEGGVASIDKEYNIPSLKPEKLDEPKRELLREFFRNYKGKLIYHNASYDIKILIYTLFMKDILDQEGLLEGLEVLTRNFHDTKVITYLATNSTAGNKLSLKDQAHEFAGNYAQSDIDDIRNMDKQELMTYNLVDCLSTWYVYNKHYQTMLDDNQLWIYENIMLPSLKVIIQMELTGMCLSMERVEQAIRKVDRNLRWFTDIVMAHSGIDSVIKYKKTKKLITDNEKLKNKVRTIDELDYIGFKAGSVNDLQILLHEILKYPIIDVTETKAPATGAKTLKKHIKLHARDNNEKKLLRALIHIADASIIRNNFLKNFAKACPAPDGMHYLFGNFNLGGTVSGRLSSSKPNLQNIPSTGTPYAKMIKRCFVSPKGWVFCGADFALT